MYQEKSSTATTPAVGSNSHNKKVRCCLGGAATTTDVLLPLTYIRITGHPSKQIFILLEKEDSRKRLGASSVNAEKNNSHSKSTTGK
jgi:hypothetical protein